MWHPQQKNKTSAHTIVTHTTDFINRVDILIVVFILACFGAGCLIDAKLPSYTLGGGHPSAKVISLLVSSYLLLLPGLFTTLFTFLIKVVINGQEIDTTAVLKRPGGLNESMISLCQMLFDTGGILGGILIILYAMVVPIVKLTLLTFGEIWRHSEDTAKVQQARWCVIGVQQVSKWACPDMFAYILILYLFRAFNKPGSIIKGPASLDVGFTCFSMFCVLSTISTLAIQPPKAETEKIIDPPWLVKYFGLQGAKYCSFVLVFPLLMLLGYGIWAPCMGMRLDADLLIAANGMDPGMKKAMDSLKIADMVHTDVSLANCIMALCQWFATKFEVTSGFAAIMLGIFVGVLTFLDAISLALAALKLDAKPSGGKALARAHVLKHVSMLDVFVMGVLVTCLAGNAYRDRGTVFIVEPGLLALLLAEFLHYAMYNLVSSAASYVDAMTDIGNDVLS
mmetsp:Transcript_28568/g.51749  ORF Transcript_28568/g.51749 Transcript_28568/m.51749 type:complete len:452 (-) Transcript_28568:67-1422(-)